MTSIEKWNFLVLSHFKTNFFNLLPLEFFRIVVNHKNQKCSLTGVGSISCSVYILNLRGRWDTINFLQIDFQKSNLVILKFFLLYFELFGHLEYELGYKTFLVYMLKIINTHKKKSWIMNEIWTRKFTSWSFLNWIYKEYLRE